MRKVSLLIIFLFGFCKLSSQVNFTASLGNADKKIIFHIDESSIKIKSNTNYLWIFGDGETSTEKQPTHLYKKAGTYTICLQINDKKQVCKENVFTVTETGLKVKYVNDFIWPSGSISKVDSPFSYRIKADGKTFDFHRALDIVGEIGDDIKAVADGKVYKSFGSTLVVKHKMDTPMFINNKVTDLYYTMSLHLNERYVEKGETVKKGDVIAAVGEIGSRNYPHNHFEIRVGSYYSKVYLEKAKNSNKADKNTNINPKTGNFIDPQVNPLLFLDNTDNEKNSLKYSVSKKGTILFVKVISNYLEDYFNEIVIKHSSETEKEETLKLNFNTRQGLPYLSEKEKGDLSSNSNNSDYDYQDLTDNFDIHPIKFKYRNKKDYQIIFSFKILQFNPKNGDYILVKDIFGNVAKEVKSDF